MGNPITIAAAVKEARAIVQGRSIGCWRLGEIADLVTAAYGPAGLRRLAEGADINLSTLRTYRWVSRAYPSLTPAKRARTSFGVAHAFAGLEDRLDLLAQRDWSSREAIAHKYGRNGKPRPSARTKEEKALDENGWAVLEGYMALTDDALGGLSERVNQLPAGNKERFLAELPRIRTALDLLELSISRELAVAA